MGICSSSNSRAAYVLAVSSSPPPPEPSWLALPPHLDSRPSPSSSSAHAASHRLQSKMLHSPASTSLADFKVEKVLGRGKFGEVVLARNNTDQRYYAVKQILKTQIGDGRYNMESVSNEIACLFKLRHPFVAHLFGYYEDGSACSLVLEYCCGGELFNRLRRCQSFPAPVAKFYFAEIALALNYLHAPPLHLVYRDLKPENVMLSNAGHVKLVDFGFAARLAPGKEDEGITSGGCGTAMYVAPEVASGHMKKRHGFPVDWWSLGVMLYEMLTGKAPFGDTADVSKFEVLNAITAGKVSFPFGVGSDARQVVSGLLTLDPAKRFGFKDVASSSFLSGVDLAALLNGRIRAPWSPADARGTNASEDKVDVANFLDWSPVRKGPPSKKGGKVHADGDAAAAAAAAAGEKQGGGEKLDKRSLPQNIYAVAVGASGSGVVVAPGWALPSSSGSSSSSSSSSSSAAAVNAASAAGAASTLEGFGAKKFASAGVAAGGVLKAKKKMLDGQAKRASVGGGAFSTAVVAAEEGGDNDSGDVAKQVDDSRESSTSDKQRPHSKISVKKPHDPKSPPTTHKKNVEDHRHDKEKLHRPKAK